MDVSKNDPTAIFIHPPFVVPPPPEGEDAPPISESEPPPGTPLTYAILHAHRNWFLDADDFGKDNPNRIDYPPELEPPRGWAPLNECLGSGAIKKQKEKLNNGLRTKGSYVTPEQLGVVEYGPSDDCHELTVLRCTFCRREYHGPNAKSMWRRHVYDKHKVAMKNRREGSAGAAIRNMLKKPKGQVSPDPGDMTSPADPPQGPLDLNSELFLLRSVEFMIIYIPFPDEQNIIRLLERVVSGDLQLCLPASVLGGNSIDLQTIANALHASGITVSLNNNNLEIVSPCQPEVASNLSGGLREIQPPTDDSTTSSQSISVDKPPKDQGSPKFSKRDAENGEERKSTAPRERTPLKDNTFADRNYHNSAITPPGTPRKDKTKQRNLSNSPAARFAQNVTPVVSPSRTTFHYYSNYRSLTSTALRARALATTGEESYLTLLASSPSTTSNSPMKPLNHNTPSNLNRSSPFFKVKPRGPGTSDDIGILGIPSPRFSFHLHMEPSDNSAYMPSFDPVEVNSEALTPIAAILAPPVQVDEKPSSAPSTNRTSKGENNEDTSGELALRYPESSPLNRVQRRRSSKNDDKEQEDFDMDHFIDLKDSGTSPTAPSSPQKISLSRGFAKEFGLLSQEEVDRIAGSLQPGFSEDFRNPKRRRIGSPV